MQTSSPIRPQIIRPLHYHLHAQSINHLVPFPEARPLQSVTILRPLESKQSGEVCQVASESSLRTEDELAVSNAKVCPNHPTAHLSQSGLTDLKLDKHVQCTEEKPSCKRCQRLGLKCQRGIKLLFREDAIQRGIQFGREGNSKFTCLRFRIYANASDTFRYLVQTL